MEILRRILGSTIFVLALVSAVVLGIAAVRQADRTPRTDDAFLTADIVHMAPEVAGRIVEMRVKDNQLVERGDVLFVIDREPYGYRVEEAKGKIRMLEATLVNETNEVASQATRAEAAKTAIASARAELALASETRKRIEPLAKPGYVSAEQLDTARTNERTASTTLQEKLQQATEARQAVANTEATKAELANARVALQSAERDLRLTTVLAPCRGRITALSVAAGEYATVGKAVFTIVDTERWWAVGNFKETDILKLKNGATARVYVMSDPTRPLSGVLVDKAYGVSPQEDQPSGGLPDVPRSLNWVRIAQRFPVRIRLDDPPEELMRMGASVVIVVDAK